MTFVNFMIIGAQKCGTTTLAEILASHPDVCFSKVKEPHFFSKTNDWQRNIEDYKRLYEPKSNQICGEGSTTYTCYPEFNKAIWNDIYQFNPNLKLIYIMRNPVDRIVSHYMHNYLKGYTSKTIDEAILSNPTYINRSRYFVQIKPYVNIFGQKQVLLITLEELIANPETCLDKISSFLLIERTKFIDPMKIHANQSIGNRKNDVRVNNFIKNNLAINSAKKMLPKFVRNKAYGLLQKSVARKLEETPQITNGVKQVIYNLLALDICEIKILMNRELIEWNLGNEK